MAYGLTDENVERDVRMRFYPVTSDGGILCKHYDKVFLKPQCLFKRIFRPKYFS